MKNHVLLVLFFLFLLGCEKSEDIEDPKKEPEEEPSKDPDKEIPTISCSLISHSENDTVFNNINTVFKAEVSTEYTNVSKVEFYFNGKLEGISTTKPYTIESKIKDYNPGICKFTVIAISETGLQSKSEINVIFAVKLRDAFQGGRIFKISDDGLHGLIVANEDLNGTYIYGLNRKNGATSFDDGKSNTEKLGQYSSNFAAHGCLNFRGGDYDDWYLPAFNELRILKKFRELLGLSLQPTNTDPTYWSSTESETQGSKAYSQCFGAEKGQPGSKDRSYKVRPVRSF